MISSRSFDGGYFRVFPVLVAVILGLSVTAATASAANPPKCHGKKATVWSKTDAPRILEGTSGPDVFVTGKGDDTITGNEGRDVICSHGGKDHVFGGPGLDRIYTGMGDDFVAGDGGDDVLCAYEGRDAVFGGAGSDWISVGNGDAEVNLYDADGKGTLDNRDYLAWIADGYSYSFGSGSGEDDVMTGDMIHAKGAKLEKRWYC